MIRWTIILIALLALAGIIFAVTTAHAGSVTGNETITDYRGWSEGLQTGYVLGVMGTATRIASLICRNPGTVGVMMAWLASDQVKSSDNAVEAIIRLSIEKHGCFAKSTPKEGA